VKWANQKTVPPNYSEMPIVFTLFSLVACLLDFIYDIYSYNSKWASCKGPFVSLDNTSIGNHTHTRTRAHMQYAERERGAYALIVVVAVVEQTRIQDRAMRVAVAVATVAVVVQAQPLVAT
jgi:predicted HAD superfamily phosphohydrolase YqeG